MVRVLAGPSGVGARALGGGSRGARNGIEGPSIHRGGRDRGPVDHLRRSRPAQLEKLDRGILTVSFVRYLEAAACASTGASAGRRWHCTGRRDSGRVCRACFVRRRMVQSLLADSLLLLWPFVS